MSYDCSLQWRGGKIWNICPHWHGSQQDDEGLQGDRYSCHIGAHPGPESRNGTDTISVWVLSDGSGRGDTCNFKIIASITLLGFNLMHFWRTDFQYIIIDYNRRDYIQRLWTAFTGVKRSRKPCINHKNTKSVVVKVDVAIITQETFEEQTFNVLQLFQPVITI